MIIASRVRLPTLCGQLAHGKGRSANAASAITDDFEQVTVGVEEVEAIMIAPVDRRGALDCGLRQTGAGRGEVRMTDAKGVMAAT